MLLGYELDVWVYSQAEEWWFFFTHSYPYWPWYPHSLGLILGGRAVEIFLNSFVTRLALRSTQSSFMPGNRGVEIFLQSSCPDWHGIHSIWDWSWAAEGWRFFFHSFMSRLAQDALKLGLIWGNGQVVIFLHSFMSRLTLGLIQGSRGVEILLHLFVSRLGMESITSFPGGKVSREFG